MQTAAGSRGHASGPMRPWLCLAMLLLLLLLLPVLAQAAPRAWLDRDRVQFGETVTLNVETDARGGREPDFSVLDANFRRLSTSSTTQLSIVNGQQTARTLWAVALEPLQEGVIGIPALDVGPDRTEALSLTVLPASTAATGSSGEDVFIEIDASPDSPYVQQQVRYIVRLYYGVTLLEGQLEEPQVDGAQLRRLGQDINYYRSVGQRRYQVVERRYALVPETSGALEIPGPRFSGRALRAGGYGSMLGANTRLGARGASVSLDVRPRPAGSADPWLPARSVQIEDESVAMPDAPTVGEPITLTLRLHAQGLSAEQLPELVLPEIEGAEVYPDQETTQNRDDGEWMRGERVRKFAVVPTRPGRLRLPAMEISWWNVDTDRAAQARLPAREWMIEPAPGGTGRAAAEAEAEAEAGSSPTADGPGLAGVRAWQFASLILALLWLATWWRLRSRRERATVPVASTPAPTAVRADTWRQALAREEPALIARGLIEAARHSHPAIGNLSDLAAQLDDPTQRAALRQLEFVLYRGADDSGLRQVLRGAFSDGPRWRPTSGVPRGATGDTLPPLYPDRG